MLYIDANGYIDALRITKKIFPSLHHGEMAHVNDIIVHQTGAATLQSTFTVTEQQNESLKWLVNQLKESLGISTNEIYRHPEIARKTPTEASTAKW